MDAITFRFLISLAASKNLEMHLMVIVIACLYGSLDYDIYIYIYIYIYVCVKIPEGLKIP